MDNLQKLYLAKQRRFKRLRRDLLWLSREFKHDLLGQIAEQLAKAIKQLL
jgi:hypothetical protein